MTRRAKVLSAVLVLVAVTLLSLGLVVSHDSPCGTAPALPANTTAMRAIVYRCYGAPDVVKLEEVAKPAPRDHGVLIKVHAASINPLDWHSVRGNPYIMRLQLGVGAPKDVRLGIDFAGTVEAVGKYVTGFKPGDEVFGGADGAVAEYVTVSENGGVALKPANVTFEQAAAVPVAALTALQALRDKGKVQPGQKVLINGASGGVGTFAVQIAKSYSLDVTGVSSTRNVELVKSLGANQVVDYTVADYTRSPQRYDLIIDLVCNRSVMENRRVLKPGGTYVGIGGGGLEDGGFLGPMVGALKLAVVSPFVSQKLEFFIADLNQDDLAFVAHLMQTGKVTSVIDRRYPFADTAAALRYLEQGHARGKVVISVQ